MFKINLLSKLTLISCIYITVVPCFIVNESPFVSKQNQLLIQKTDVKTKTDTLLENLAKIDDTTVIRVKEMDIKNYRPSIISTENVYTPSFPDNGAAL
ncbi:hypothetical protein [Flavobacterium lindanitolerans]|uniref:hypothetical protein n=1 Tax=Flavobacterium lindanitolerans TaxID=428988 RepID=UPI0027B8C2BE|nr:hypothetical protein [Flavobacterium lindanitolerans]